MEVSDARKLKALEDENRKLKKLLAESVNRMSPRCLANLLQRLEDSGKEAAGVSGRKCANVYLASHPATAERIDALGGPACE